ncbi:MAG: SpoIIE family protein phosphatase [Spirochaetales bacterium]|nr:SpoIIE family protein phosphatase [Spirochaetales bacterium]
MSNETKKGETKKKGFLSFWEKLKIRYKILFIMIPVAVIPLIIIVSFTSAKIYNHLKEQGRANYTAYISQVTKNINFVYGQYARTMSNMLEIPALIQAFNAPPYNNEQTEKNVDIQMIGDVNTRGGLRQTFEEKIDGILYVVELDRKSIADNKDYKEHLTVTSQTRLNIDLLLKDPLFLKLKNNNAERLVFGRLSEGVINSDIYGNAPVMIYPYYAVPPENPEDTFEKFLLVTLAPGFLEQFYKDVAALQYGTLYILDTNNNIVSYNHPRDDDDYSFHTDEKTGKPRYILSEGDDRHGYGGLSFDDYRMLNIDNTILQTEYVRKTLEELETDQDVIYEEHYIEYNNKQFLMILGYEQQSKTKYVYFYPVKQFQKPIEAVVRIIIFISFLMVIIIAVISVLFSLTITNPIKALLDATQVVTQGNYNHFIKTDYEDEIGDLSNNFNQMIRNIKSYQDRLLSAEREKSEMELASRIQTSLSPAIPSKEMYDITAVMLPAAEVGGDYYDLIEEDNGRIWFGIGDVSGHGLTSGLIMMMAQTAFNTILLNEPDISSDKLVSHVNKVMYQNIKQRLGEDHFMTLSFMVANPDGTVCTAGCHLDILVWRNATKKVERIVTNGIWLGLIPDIEDNTTPTTFKLESGDFMFLYTDGLIEAADANNKLYDMDRLIEKLEEFGSMPVKDIEEHIISDVYTFMDEQKDDITFVIARKV